MTPQADNRRQTMAQASTSPRGRPPARGAAVWSAAGAAAAFALALGMVAPGTNSGRAAELRLRPQCQCRRPLVTLGDVAEIFATDAGQADALAAIELLPAPSATHPRYLRLREIQDLLLLRGINLAEHRFSGSSRVTIVGIDEDTADPGQERPSPPAVARTANRRVSEAVVQYLCQLRQDVSAEVPWMAEVQVPPSHARSVADPGRAISIAGGRPPWTGPQRFEVSVETADGRVQFPVDAEVSAPPAVVVAASALPRGALIRPEDVELQYAAARDGQADAFHSIHEVVGKETARAVPKGKTLKKESVRAPLLVQRRDVVTVLARNAGIRVRTMGRARDQGSLGDLIAVEPLEDRRQHYYARVSGVRQVEVYARSAKAARDDAGSRPPAVSRQSSAFSNRSSAIGSGPSAGGGGPAAVNAAVALPYRNPAENPAAQPPRQPPRSFRIASTTERKGT